MRTVFKSHDEVCHEFANIPLDEIFDDPETRSGGRVGRSGNIFFYNGCLYSYGRHFTLAQYVKNDAGDIVTLISERDYSSSTAKHKSIVASAIWRERIYVPTLDGSYPLTLGDLWVEELISSLKKLARARTRGMSHWNEINRVRANIEHYYGFFPEEQMPDSLAKILRKIDSGDTLSVVKTHLEADKKRAKELAEERREERRKEHEKIEEWRTFARTESHIFTRFTQSVALRYNEAENRIETSKAVNIGLAEARTLYNAVQMSLKRKDYTKIVGTRVLESFIVRSLDENNLIIGCHTIPHSEINRIAEQLDWVNK